MTDKPATAADEPIEQRPPTVFEVIQIAVMLTAFLAFFGGIITQHWLIVYWSILTLIAGYPND